MCIDLPFRVIFEDQHVLVVEKPTGMVVHPAYGHYDGTLADTVAEWQAGRGLSRPWLVHRLDKDTSGLVLFAKSEHALRLCTRQFTRHTVDKRYLALVWGADIADKGTVDAPICRDPEDRHRMIVSSEDGQDSLTSFSVCERHQNSTLVELKPKTGRMHQLRIHMASIGHPIVGDPVYALTHPSAPRLMLHAAMLSIYLPGQRHPTFLAPPPPDFCTVYDMLLSPLNDS
jgi:23S rRNA pseudouridine1911/1915/1917 synthase